MRAQIVETGDALEALEASWWGLFARVPAATPFASPAWLLPWWRSFAPGALFTIAVWDAGRLVALAPLYSEEDGRGNRLLPLGIGATDLMDVLIDPACAAAAGAVLGEALAGAGGRWRCWSAEEAPPGAAVLAIADPPGWRSSVTTQSSCPVLSLEPGLREAIPARQWRKWHMAQNRAGRRRWAVRATTRATLADDLAHLARLHAARWQARGEPGVLADRAVRRFHAAAAEALLAAGLLRMTTLRIDDAVAGVFYGLQSGETAYAYLGGFDPAYAFESPGTLLIGHALQHAAEDGLRRFDFLRGKEAYKYAWGATDRVSQRRLFEPIP